MTIRWQLCHHERLLSLRDYLMSDWLCFCLYLNFMSFSSPLEKGHWLLAKLVQFQNGTIPHTWREVKSHSSSWALWHAFYWNEEDAICWLPKLKGKIFFLMQLWVVIIFISTVSSAIENITFTIFRMLIFSPFSFCISLFII